MIKILVKAGADKEAQIEGGLRPLHAAAVYGHVSVVDVLLKSGADKDAKTEDGSRAVDIAAAHPAVVDLLSKAAQR